MENPRIVLQTVGVYKLKTIKTAMTLGLLLSCFVPGQGLEKNGQKVFTADLPEDSKQEISIRIGARSQSEQIGVMDESGGGDNSTSGGGSASENTSLEKCGVGAKCCYQYTWPGYRDPDNIPQAENATCDYLKKSEWKDPTAACFDPMVFTKSRGSSFLSTPPDFEDLTRQAAINQWPIVCPMSTKTCVTYTYYNNEKAMANQTKFCGMVTDNSDKQLKNGCYRQQVQGMVREVCVCDKHLCNSPAPTNTPFPSLLILLTIPLLSYLLSI